MKTCLLLVGDAPNILGGLARIARDIAMQALSDQEVDVYQAGLRYDGSVWPWHVFPIFDEAEWGNGDWPRIFSELSRGFDSVVVLTVWDPHRCFPLATYVQRQREEYDARIALWGYFPVDGHDAMGAFGGPAAEALGWYDRVLAYGRYGAEVLQQLWKKGTVEALPHGLTDDWYPRPNARGQFLEHFGWKDDGRPLIGVVATNQARKDWGTVFEVASSLDARLWCHIDVLERHWSITELVRIYGLSKEDVAVSRASDDDRLATFYSACNVTFAPGLGEGFGYPIVESLACGTPVVHADYAGGAEHVPLRSWLTPPLTLRPSGLYAVQRPVLNAEDLYVRLAERIEAGKPSAAWSLLQTSHLRWRRLQPRWRSWVRRGLEELPWADKKDE